MMKVSIRSLADAVRSRRTSSLDLVTESLARIERHNKALNAVVTLDGSAIDRARAADAAALRGESWGSLHGVPFTLKDSLATQGVRTTVGYPPLSDYVPDADSAVAARLKAAGAILLGKTNVPPLCMSLQTDNPIFGRTNNPWNLGCTPGGSSGGAAAAVAASLTPFDVGSDISGSIRIPAHYCGIYGFKPTSNRVSGRGHIPPPPNTPRIDRHLASLGPLARSVDDLALITSVLVGRDPADSETFPLPWREAPRRDLSKLRIAWRSAWPGVPTARSVREAVERIAVLLADAGAQVEEGDPGFSRDEVMAVWDKYFPALSQTMMQLMNSSLPVKPTVSEAPTMTSWIEILNRRDRLLRAMDEALTDRFDVFLCPAVIAQAFPHSPPRSPIPVDEDLVDSRFVDHYLFPFNLLGAPSVVLPAGLDAQGLPIGVQLVAARWHDEELLSSAHAIDEAIAGYRAPPNFDLN